MLYRVIKNIEYKYKKLVNTLVLLINNLIRLFYKNNNSELKKIIKENRYILSKSSSFLTSTQYKENKRITTVFELLIVATHDFLAN